MTPRPAGPGEANEEADVIDEEHAPVRNDPETKPRPRFSGARTAAGGALPFRARPLPRADRGARTAAGALVAVAAGRAFAAVTLAPALLAVAWLVPGIGMLLAGRLLPMPMVIIFVPLAVALCYFAMRRLPVGWPRVRRVG